MAAARQAPYLPLMPWFPRPSSPRAAFADLKAFLGQRSREQVIGLVLAILVTAILVIEFLVDSQINTAPPPQVVYVESYSANRTDAEIIADQNKDQAEREQARRERQEYFQKLENRLGM